MLLFLLACTAPSTPADTADTSGTGDSTPADDTADPGGIDVTAVITDVEAPIEAAYAADGSAIFVLAQDGRLYASPTDGGEPSTLLATIDGATGFAVLPDGDTLWITAGSKQYLGTLQDAAFARTLTLLEKDYEEVGTESADGAADEDAAADEALGGMGVYVLTDGPAVYHLDLANDAVETVFRGAPLVSPSRMTVASDGTVWVVDRAAGSDGGGAVVRIRAGEASVVAEGFVAGEPAGVALTVDESTVLVSSLDATGHSQVFIVDAATYATATFNGVIGANTASGGLVRSRVGEDGRQTFAWCGVNAGANGTVYRVDL